MKPRTAGLLSSFGVVTDLSVPLAARITRELELQTSRFRTVGCEDKEMRRAVLLSEDSYRTLVPVGGSNLVPIM